MDLLEREEEARAEESEADMAKPPLLMLQLHLQFSVYCICREGRGAKGIWASFPLERACGQKVALQKEMDLIGWFSSNCGRTTASDLCKGLGSSPDSGGKSHESAYVGFKNWSNSSSVIIIIFIIMIQCSTLYFSYVFFIINI